MRGRKEDMPGNSKFQSFQYYYNYEYSILYSRMGSMMEIDISLKHSHSILLYIALYLVANNKGLFGNLKPFYIRSGVYKNS